MSSMEVRKHLKLPHELSVAIQDAADDAGVSFNMYIRLVMSKHLGVPIRPHGNTRKR